MCIGAFNFAITISATYYLTEIFPDRKRAFGAGLAVAGYQLGISAINAAAVFKPFSWRWQVFVVAGVCVAVTELTCHFAEESPRWYMRNGRASAARKVLRKIYVKPDFNCNPRFYNRLP